MTALEAWKAYAEALYALVKAYERETSLENTPLAVSVVSEARKKLVELHEVVPQPWDRPIAVASEEKPKPGTPTAVLNTALEGLSDKTQGILVVELAHGGGQRIIWSDGCATRDWLGACTLASLTISRMAEVK